MSDYVEVTLPCDACGGLEINFNSSESPHCPVCKGQGVIIKGGFYNSMKKVKEDYPTAIKTIVIR